MEVLVCLFGDGERRLQFGWNFNVVVAVDAKNILDNVARTPYVYTVGRHDKVESFGIFLHDFHFKTCCNALNRVCAELFSDKAVGIFVVQTNGEAFHFRRIYVANLHTYLAACKLFAENGCLLEGINGSVGVDSTLETEARIGRKTMATRTLANPSRVEVGTFQHYVACVFVCSTALSAEYSGNAHWFFGVANSKVVLAKGMFLAVERDELLAFVLVFHDDLPTCYHICIEAVHRLSVSHHNVIGNVYNVVDRANANYVEPVFQPLWAFFYLAIGNAKARIATASVRVFYLYFDRKVVVVYFKLAAIRAMQRCFVSVLLQPRIKVARYAVMAQRIGTVGSNVYFNQPVAVELVILCCRHTHLCIFGQNNNAVVACSYADFVFSANHSQTLDTSQLTLLDGERVVAIVQYTA